MAEKILVIEDEEDVAYTIQLALSEEGYQVRVASDGPSALKIARQWLPDLILIDVRLPGMDGFEICRRMRKLEQVATVPIIIVTAKSDIAAKAEGFEAGADDYITKPFEIAELPLRVAAQFRRTKLSPDGHREPDGLQVRPSGLRLQRWQEYLLAAAAGFALGGTIVGLALMLG